MSWAEKSIGEISKIVTKGTTPSTYGMPFTDEGINFIKAEALNGDVTLARKGFTFIADETHEKLKRSQLCENDVLITIAGANVGKCGYVRQADVPANTNQAVGIIRIKPGHANPRYIYFHFKKPDTFAMCQGIGGGQAAQPNINLTMLKNFKISLPDIQRQNQIVDIIGAYDDLIENNKRRIELLEESARQLYKEWFVRFRFSGYEHVKIIDGVPEGWEKKSFRDIFTLNYGKALKADNRIPGEYPVYGSSGVVGSHNKALTKGPGIIVGRKGNVGSIYWSNLDFFPIDTVYFITSEESSFYIYFVLLHTTFMNTDVAVPGLNRDFAYSREIVLSPDTLREEFEKEIAPIFKQCQILCSYNDKLSEARDLLLPKLMSGEISV